MMDRSRTVVIGLVAFCAFGCLSAQQTTTGGWLSSPTDDGNRGTLVMRVPDAVERGEGRVGGSGQALTTQFLQAMAQRGIKTSVTDETDLDSAREQARERGLLYVMRAEFTIWEDNATAWSGNPDRCGASAELYSVKDGELVATASHNERASSATLVSSSPQRFYGPIVDALVGRLFP